MSVSDIAVARTKREFIKSLIVAANKANTLRFARWEEIANREKPKCQ